jgi:DNA polymerase-3 subunit delta
MAKKKNSGPNPAQIIKDIRQNVLSPVYFLQGDETFYIDQISNVIEQEVLSEADKGFNQMVMYGKDVDMATVLNAARRFPMMAERQVVIVKEAQEISDLGKESGQKQLEAYVKNPLPSTVLVFCHKLKKLDGRSALAKVIGKHAVVITTEKLYDNQVPDWINQHVITLGHTIEPKAAQMLSEAIGNNLDRIHSELQKLLLNFSGQVNISPDHVQRYIGISKEYNAFELQKALGIGDVVKANRIIMYFASNPKKHSAIAIIALLYSYFSKLLKLHHQKAYSDRDVAQALGIHPFVARDYVAALRTFSAGKTVNNLIYLAEADRQTKGIEANAPESEILKELVYKLMH